MTTARELIRQSIKFVEIIHAAYSEPIATDLLLESDDHVRNGDVVEYWGTTGNGDVWRVHLKLGK